MAAALLPAVRAALAAAPGSANAGVEVEDMMKFVLALTREEAPAEGGRVTMHEELALALCCEVPPAATDASPMGVGMGGGGGLGRAAAALGTWCSLDLDLCPAGVARR